MLLFVHSVVPRAEWFASRRSSLQKKLVEQIFLSLPVLQAALCLFWTSSQGTWWANTVRHNTVLLWQRGNRNNLFLLWLRLVSLTSATWKILEWILKGLICKRLENNLIISSSQNGFAPNRSCQTFHFLFDQMESLVDCGGSQGYCLALPEPALAGIVEYKSNMSSFSRWGWLRFISPSLFPLYPCSTSENLEEAHSTVPSTVSTTTILWGGPGWATSHRWPRWLFLTQEKWTWLSQILLPPVLNPPAFTVETAGRGGGGSLMEKLFPKPRGYFLSPCDPFSSMGWEQVEEVEESAILQPPLHSLCILVL